MSWSISALGKPEDICGEMLRYLGTLNGQSANEFHDAMPYLQGLLRQNFVTEAGGGLSPLIRLDANGSGSADASGNQLRRQCNVTIKPEFTKLV